MNAHLSHMRNQLKWQCAETVSPRINPSRVFVFVFICAVRMLPQWEILFQFGRVYFILVPKMLLKKLNRKWSDSSNTMNITCILFSAKLVCSLANLCQIKVQRIHSLKHTLSMKISDNWTSQTIWQPKIKKSIEFYTPSICWCCNHSRDGDLFVIRI